MFDVFEDFRSLSPGELLLRRECQDRLTLALRERAAFWKQRGKYRAMREGDANTRFFHAQATHRLRRNTIRSVTVGGSVLSSHREKTEALTAHLRTLLGEREANLGAVDVATLYRALPCADSVPLLTPFTEHEARAGVRAMNKASSPGPDGFGPSFYHAAWSTVAPAVMNLAREFLE